MKKLSFIRYWHSIVPGFSILYILTLTACISPGLDLKTLSETDPQFVVSQKDSILLRSEKDPGVIPLVIAAYINLSDKALEKKDYEAAENYMLKALEIDKTNGNAKYAYAMAKGHRLFKGGNNSQLWDAIEQFSKASYYKPEDGISVYWSAKGYSKKDDSDYQNIIELYQKSIELGLPKELEADAKASLIKVEKEKELLESFWK